MFAVVGIIAVLVAGAVIIHEEIPENKNSPSVEVTVHQQVQNND